VTGRVQGVSYRASTASEARRHALVGSLRNRPDSSVEHEAEGPAEKVASLRACCEHGPPTARVERVAVEEIAATGADPAFAVVRWIAPR
jgi:acylphosphatase